MSAALTRLKGGALSDGRSMVFNRDGAVFANSRDVADFFGKRHDNVLRDIRELVAGGILNFEEGSYMLPETGPQKHPCFDMNRDGFTYLAMGFTGRKALAWKVLYVRAFNKMEATLRSAAPMAATGELSAGDCHRIGGIVKAVTHKAITDRLGPIEDKLRRIANGIAIIGGEAVADQRVAAVEYRPMLEVLVELGVPAKGRRPICVRASARLRRWAIDGDRHSAVRRSRETGKYLFQVDAVDAWLKAEGRALIAASRAALDGQAALPLRARRPKAPPVGGAG